MTTRHLPGQHDQKTHGKGHGGTHGSGDSKDDPIVTSDVEIAARALHEGKYVRLRSTRQASTLLSNLADEVKQSGGSDIDLCKVSVKGTNLFCVESKGIPRVQMPQLKANNPVPGSKADALPRNAKGEVDLGPAFVEHLRSQGIDVAEDRVPAAVLKASQNQLNGAKVLGIAGAMREGKVPDEQIFVTSDDYVVDGHHRWAASVANDLADGRIDNDITIGVKVIDVDIITALDAANKFAADWGIPQADVARRAAGCGCSTEEVPTVRLRWATDPKSGSPLEGVEERGFELRGGEKGPNGGRILEGYAVVFNSPTTIRGEGADFEEVVLPGATRRSIGRLRPKLMFNHGQHPLFGELPFGRWLSAEEDNRGLFVRAEMFRSWLWEPLVEALDAGEIAGQSFRFSVPHGGDSWDYRAEGLPRRSLSAVNVMELGPVIWPAYEQTSVKLRMAQDFTEQMRSVFGPFPALATHGPAGEPASTDDLGRPAPSSLSSLRARARLVLLDL